MAVDHEFASFTSAEDWVFLILALFCVTCAALAAGLTLGILSLDTLKLQIKVECGNEKESKAAREILPLLENRHLLLCTLLIFNSAANEALPIFLDGIVPSYAAIIISVTLVLICGEVLPAAFFTGPNQLEIASKLKPFVSFLIFLFYPLARPMGMGLDHLLGEEEEDVLSREELSVLMHIIRTASIQHFESELKKGETGDDQALSNMLSQEEVKTITGVLGMAKKTIRDVMVPIEKVHMISSDLKFEEATLKLIDKIGHSRIPVYKGSNKSRIIGYLLVKKLILNPDISQTVGNSTLISPLVVGANQSLHNCLAMFQSGKAHLAIVSENPNILAESLKSESSPPITAAPIGIVTIEDIIEEILQQEIYDETDSDRTLSPDTARDIIKLIRTPTLVNSVPRTKSLASSPAPAPRIESSHGSASKETTKKGILHSTILTKFSRTKTSNQSRGFDDDFSQNSKRSLLSGEQKKAIKSSNSWLPTFLSSSQQTPPPQGNDML